MQPRRNPTTCIRISNRIVGEAILDDVRVDDLRYTQRSISSCFGYGASLEDLVRWLDERGKRGGGGCDAPFDLNEWRANGRLQVVRRANGVLESNDNRRLWCLKEHQRNQSHPVRTRVWIFPLPSVFETYVRHRNVSPARESIRRRGGNGHWRAVASVFADGGVVSRLGYCRGRSVLGVCRCRADRLDESSWLQLPPKIAAARRREAPLARKPLHHRITEWLGEIPLNGGKATDGGTLDASPRPRRTSTPTAPCLASATMNNPGHQAPTHAPRESYSSLAFGAWPRTLRRP